MKPFRFLEWQVYKDSKTLFRLVHDIVGKLPKELRYDLGGQIIRACSSVIFNIAEGSGKKSDKELNRYFDIALGSLNETVAGVDVLLDNGLITSELFGDVVQKAEAISKQLGGFKKKLS
ncbi:MAG TPA: four helix bundle protein [Nitrospirota bacterium]|nr:four helix bundle protein [Nitrospirota bacterium]